MVSFSAYDFVIFDLDGTLYDEELYLKAAYESIANTISFEYNLNANEMGKFLLSEFHNEGRSRLFDKLCLEYSLPDSAIIEMLTLMRAVNIKEGLPLYEKMERLVKALIEVKKKLFIVTNGNPEQQRNKVKLLQWHGLDSDIEVVYANTLKPKPDRASFDFLVEKFGVIAAKTVFIGDSDTDSDFARNCGIAFIKADKILHAKKYIL